MQTSHYESVSNFIMIIQYDKKGSAVCTVVIIVSLITNEYCKCKNKVIKTKTKINEQMIIENSIP